MPRMLINASNLHVGGGVQVATSFIEELCGMPALPQGLVVWASSAVDVNLRRIGCDLSALPAYEVVDARGLRLLYSPLKKRLQSFDAIFTVFGPLYVWNLLGVRVTGFAQPWIIYPDNHIARSMRWSERLTLRFKYWLQGVFFRRSDQLVVELEHVRAALMSAGLGSESTIEVVLNSLSSIYMSPDTWQRVDVPDAGFGIKIGFVGRNYLHKNTRIFPEVIEILRRDYGVMSRIYVTFNDEEWAMCDDAFRASVCNVGPLFVNQCPLFYKSLDAVIFPSLLECFSATPLEAMAMEKPLFVSDRPFNRDICLRHAHYFDPLNPASAAKVIADVFLGAGPSRDALLAAREHAIHFSSPKERAERYLALLMQAAVKTHDGLTRS